jgi:hypothetical protein
MFLFTTASKTTLRPTQPPIRWVPGTLSLETKRLGPEADHSPPSRVIYCVELYLHSPNTTSWRGAHLKAQWQFYLTFTLHVSNFISWKRSEVIDFELIVELHVCFHMSELFPCISRGRVCCVPFVPPPRNVWTVSGHVWIKAKILPLAIINVPRIHDIWLSLLFSQDLQFTMQNMEILTQVMHPKNHLTWILLHIQQRILFHFRWSIIIVKTVQALRWSRGTRPPPASPERSVAVLHHIPSVSFLLLSLHHNLNS